MSFKLRWHRLLPLVVVTVGVVVGGCSIKEDRVDCLCTLRLDLSGVDSGQLVNGGYEKLHVGAGSLPDSTLSLLEMPAEVVLDVPRGPLESYVLASDDRYIEQDGSLRIPYGQQCPVTLSHYLHSEINLWLTDTVSLHKNYSNLHIRFEGLEADYISLEVSSNVAGYDATGGLLEGDFRYVPAVVDGSLSYSCRIPRQGQDGALRLTVFYKGAELRSFALGWYILQSGYDWDAPDLEDIEMQISLTRTSITFQSDLWSKTIQYSFVV